MTKLDFSICTPYEIVYQAGADYLLFTTPEGEKGIRHGHENAVLRVLEGEIAVTNDGDRLVFKLVSGVLHLEDNRGVLITNFAALADEYDDRYRQHMQKLERHYADEMKSEADLQRAQMVMRQSLVRE